MAVCPGKRVSTAMGSHEWFVTVKTWLLQVCRLSNFVRHFVDLSLALRWKPSLGVTCVSASHVKHLLQACVAAQPGEKATLCNGPAAFYGLCPNTKPLHPCAYPIFMVSDTVPALTQSWYLQSAERSCC